MATSSRLTVLDWRFRTLHLGFAVSLIIAMVVFWPALTGPFLFDDFPNLQALGRNGGITSLDNLKSFVFSGGAGALGRPLSLLSFAINDQCWPADPWPFKYTNLLLHLLNGVLVFVLARQLGHLSRIKRERAELLALVVMSIWLLHPMQISTMMLVVQRMTELVTTFTLAGIIGYLYGRRKLETNSRQGYALMSLAIGVCGTLATLCKENGILLPLYVLTIEMTFLRQSRPTPTYQWRTWSALFLWAPLILLSGYFVIGWDRVADGYLNRDFTLTERLLTEPRILFDYLRQIFIPHLGGSGLFHDDYVWSTGLFTPISTIICIAGLVSLFALAFVARRNYPILAFAILWFFAGHVLESSFIGLELYFEHRNYLPMFGPLFAVTYYILHATSKLRRLLPASLAIFLLLEISMSWQSSHIWGNERLLANVWANENPGSLRAQQLAAAYWLPLGYQERAKQFLLTSKLHNPTHVTIDLQLVIVDCADGRLDHDQFQKLTYVARSASYDNAIFETLAKLRKSVADEQCRGLTFDQLLAVEEALLKSPRFTKVDRNLTNLYFEIAQLRASQGNLNDTMLALDQAYKAEPLVDIALQGAYWLLSAGLPNEALTYVKLARDAKPTGLYAYLNDPEDEIADMEHAILKMKRESEQQDPNNLSANEP